MDTFLRIFTVGLCFLIASSLNSCQSQTAVAPVETVEPLTIQKNSLLPVSKGDTISKLLPLSKGDTIGSATLVSRDLPQALTLVKGTLDLPFAGKHLNLSVRNWQSQRTLAVLLTDQDGTFSLDGVPAGQWLHLVAEGQLADSDKKAVFAAVVSPEQPLSQVSINLESTAFTAVLLSLQAQNASVLDQTDLAYISEQVAPLTAFVLAEMQQSPGQPLLAYTNTPAFEACLKAWQETGEHG